MRLASNGSFFGSIMPARRGSFITFALMSSRWARDLKTIQENTTTSFGLSLTLRGNDVIFPILTSSSTHSQYSSAPNSRHTAPALRDMRRYAPSFALGTGMTNPSTYLGMRISGAADHSRRRLAAAVHTAEASTLTAA